MYKSPINPNKEVYMRIREDDYPGEWEDRRERERRSDAIASIIVMGWWLIPLTVLVVIDWVKAQF